MSWSFTDSLHAAMMRLRNQTANRSKYTKFNQSSNDNTLYTSYDDKNIVQRYWPCFAIISCAMLFTIIIYTTIFLTEDTEYPICELPETLLLPTEDQTYLTYIYPRDVSNTDNKINNKFSKNEKIIFLSTLKKIHNEQKLTFDLIHNEGKNMNSIQYRFIQDCNFLPFKSTPNPNHCMKFQLVFASNRAHKDNRHKQVNIDYRHSIVEQYDKHNKHFNFHKIDPNELLMAISLNAHDFDVNRNKFFGSLRNFVGLDGSNLEEMENDENIGYFTCIDWHATRLYHGFHAVFLNKYAIGNYSGLFVPNFWNNHGQYLDFQNLLIGIQFLNLFPIDSKIRIGFNSIGAFASVNHLHFQFWNIGDNNHGLPIELTPIKVLGSKGMGRIQVNEIDYNYYPLHGLQYEMNMDRVSETDALYSDLEHMARLIFFCVEYLQRQNIAHNLMMVPGYPFKIFLVPRKSQSEFDGFDEFVTKPGFPAVSSQLILVNENEWNDMSVDQVWNTWRDRISIDDSEQWKEIMHECLMIDM
eukprot:421799_1